MKLLQNFCVCYVESVQRKIVLTKISSLLKKINADMTVMSKFVFLRILGHKLNIILDYSFKVHVSCFFNFSCCGRNLLLRILCIFPASID